MIKIKAISLWMLLLLCLILSTCGQAHESIDLSQFLELGLANHPQIKQSNIRINQAEANLANNRSLNLKLGTDLIYSQIAAASTNSCTQILGGTVQIEADLNGLVDIKYKVQSDWQNGFKFGSDQWLLQVSAPLFYQKESIPVYQQRLDTEYRLKQLKLEHRMIEQGIIMEAAECYFTIWQIEQKLTSLKTLISQTNRQITKVKEDKSKGLINDLELKEALLFQVELANRLHELQTDLLFYRETALSLYGISTTAEIEYNLNMFSQIPEPVFLPKQTAAPEIMLSRLHLSIAAQNLRQVKRTCGLQAYMQADVRDQDWTIRLVVQLPIFERAFKENQIMNAESELGVAEFALLMSKLDVYHSEISLENRLENAVKKLMLAEEFYGIAKEQIGILHQQLQLGTISFSRLFTGWVTLEQRYQDLVDAKKEYYLCQLGNWLLVYEE